MSDGKLSPSTQRQYLIINALVGLERPSLNDLYQATGIAIPSLRRHLQRLRVDFKLNICYVSEGRRGEGHYLLRGWGILDQNKFLANFGSLGEVEDD